MTRSQILQALMQELGALHAEPLSRHTFVQVGGPAEWFVVVRERQALVDAIRAARCSDTTLTVLGAGSNVLVRDGGLRGVVLKNETRSCRRIGGELIEVDSGMRFAALARSTARAGLAGLEWAAGIPGAIGGGLPTNAGAYGSELSDLLVSISTVSPDGDIATFGPDELGLSYRDSSLRSGELQGHIAVSLTLQLRQGDVYSCLAEIDRVEALRKSNAPTGPSLGSTFKNPGHDQPTAAQLIDQAGLKGRRIGAAQISNKHANYILNVDVGHARAVDFLALISLVQQQIAEQSGIRLEPEIAVLGEEANDE
ncbi:MAG: UDP-N-acetylmuramate dehydrogenase [Chloroflexota bacterium]|nr:UDP-N-acetylmuramate dehydrogenase [Chloroflexota bacterium]MDE2894155.1 UDP-N-acetylmuramate dehydrogenase [Chloroflexota bacterium]